MTEALLKTYITLNKDTIFPETGKLTQPLYLRRNKVRFNDRVVVVPFLLYTAFINVSLN